MNKEKLNDIVCQSSSDYEILDKTYDYIETLQQQVKKQKEVIDKATNELFILKDMIYKPETREENFEIQRKISSIIKRLNGAIQTYDILLKANVEENKKLKDNWNKLKEWLNNFHKSSEFEQWEIVNKMQELEGSDSNV